MANIEIASLVLGTPRILQSDRDFGVFVECLEPRTLLSATTHATTAWQWFYGPYTESGAERTYQDSGSGSSASAATTITDGGTSSLMLDVISPRADGYIGELFVKVNESPTVNSDENGGTNSFYYLDPTKGDALTFTVPELGLSLSSLLIGNGYVYRTEITVERDSHGNLVQAISGPDLMFTDGDIPAYYDASSIGPTSGAFFFRVNFLPQLGAAFEAGTIPASATPGEVIAPKLTVYDIGGDVSGTEVTDYFLSKTRDPSGDVGGRLAANSYNLSIESGQKTTEHESLAIPTNITSGSYYVIAQFNVGGAIETQDEYLGEATYDFAVSASILIGKQLAFEEQPTDTPGGAPIDVVTVDIQDANGNLISDDDSEITMQIGAGPSSALDGTLSEKAVDGVATFDDLSLSVAGNYRLKATDGNDTGSTSDSFNIGPMELQGDFTDGASSGSVEIGLAPTNGAAFAPLLEETDGTVGYGGTSITASGTFTFLQGDLGVPLFTGDFTIPGGAETTSALHASAGIKVADLDTTFSSLIFATGAGGTSSDSRLNLTGGFTLPQSLGGFKITLPSTTPFVVGPDGLGLTTGQVALPNQAFDLGNLLEIAAKSMSFQYTAATKELEIQGDFAASLKNGSSAISVNLDLTGDNFIDYEAGQSEPLKIVATFTYGDPSPTPLFDQWFSVSAAQLSVNTITNALSGSISLMVPGGKTISGNIGFLKGYLNSIGIIGTGLAIPLEPPGLFLQTVGGSLTGLAPADPNPTQITGKLGFSYGALVTADLTGSVQLGADNAVDDINGAVAVSIANGVATGSAQINDDLRKGTFGLTSLSLQAFKNTLSFRGALTGSDDGVLTGYGTGTLTLPSWASGASVSGTVQAYLSSAADTSKSYFAAWTQLNSFFGISSSIGVRYNLDGSTQLLNDGNLPVIPAPMAQIRSLIAVASSTSQSFTVKAGSPYILLSSSWAKAAATVPFQITSPNGTVYTEANLGNGVIALVPTLSGSTAKTIAINAPAAGTWQLTLPSITTLGTVTLQGFAPTPGSSVKITSPAAEVSSSAVTISYAATDSNPGAAVNLFFGTAASGLQGTLIASGLPVGTQSYAWSTKSLPVGTYHVYAIVTDTMSIPSTVYAAGTARIWPKLVFAVQPDPASVGNAINPPVVVDIEDADGEVLTTDNSSVTMRAKTGNDTLNVTVQAKNGVATFSNDLVLHKVASYTLIATDGSDVSVVSSTFVVSATAAASISGTVFDDANGDGVQDDGETGIAGITVYNDANNNGKLDPGELTTTTDVNGNYSFTGLTAGNYKIREVIPTGWKQITPSNNYGWTLTLSANQTLTGKNFGEEITTTPPPPTGGSISGSVFNDLNGNGILNTGETGLSGIVVYDDLNNDGKLDNGEPSTASDASGNYQLTSLAAGNHKIREVVPAGWKQTTPSNNYGWTITLAANQSLTGKNFGEEVTTAPPPPTGGSISGTVFDDANGDMKQDDGELGVAGWTVFLDTNNDGILDNGELSTLTNTSGGYTFSNLPAGTYIIRAIRPSGWSQTTPTNNYGQHVTIVKGKNATNVLFGEKPIA